MAIASLLCISGELNLHLIYLEVWSAMLLLLILFFFEISLRNKGDDLLFMGPEAIKYFNIQNLNVDYSS